MKMEQAGKMAYGNVDMVNIPLTTTQQGLSA
jgi:hypothetical protein